VPRDLLVRSERAFPREHRRRVQRDNFVGIVLSQGLRPFHGGNAHAIAFNLVNHNAIAAAAVKMLQRFTLGRGVTFNIKDDECRYIWPEFWERTQMKKRLKQMARDITWQGELMLRYYEDKPGYLSFSVSVPRRDGLTSLARACAHGV
jgi:hypothetical protein